MIMKCIPDLQIAGKQVGKMIPERKQHVKKTKGLVFVSGQNNPLMFLKDFESCSDVKTEKDKMYKIRDFVDECHIGKYNSNLFRSLFFNSSSSSN